MKSLINFFFDGLSFEYSKQLSYLSHDATIPNKLLLVYMCTKTTAMTQKTTKPYAKNESPYHMIKDS